MAGYQTIAEFAAGSDISKGAIYEYIKTGAIPSRAVLREGRATKIDSVVVRELLASGSLKARPGRKRGTAYASEPISGGVSAAHPYGPILEGDDIQTLVSSCLALSEAVVFHERTK